MEATLFYLSGKISAGDTLTPEEQDRNMWQFRNAARRLRWQGYEVIDPTENRHDGWTWEDYLAYDLWVIAERRPRIYCLEGWRESRGARLEVAFAKRLGLFVYNE